jgi:hypothetical protein
MFVTWVLTTLAGITGAFFGGKEFTPTPPPIIVEKPVLVPDVKTELDQFKTGWVKDHDVIEMNLDPMRTLHFDTTPAGKAAMGDDDVFLYRVVRKVNNKGPPWYPNVDQGQVGSCVGCGSKHGTDVVQATAIASGKQFEWKPISAEVIYAMSRVDIGGGRIRGDGSVGRWACEALRLGAMAPMELIGSFDLTSYSAARARQWGSTGVPQEVKDRAKQHPVRGAALVKTIADARRAINQGYPVVVCSDQGFTMERDRDGFGNPRGTWAHCMVFIATRNGNRPGLLCLNSWGDRAHTGPVWPEDAPVAAFWVDDRVADRMLSQGDSFALSDVQGFPARKPKPDWFIHNERPGLAITLHRTNDPVFNRDNHYALAP